MDLDADNEAPPTLFFISFLLKTKEGRVLSRCPFGSMCGGCILSSPCSSTTCLGSQSSARPLHPPTHCLSSDITSHTYFTS